MNSSIRARTRSMAALALFCLATAWSSFAAAQQLSVGDVSIAEGDSGTKSMVFTVELSAASATAVRFDYATVSDTASDVSDYTATSNTGARIAAGITSKTISVPILGDSTVEANESFMLNLTNPVGATIADGQAVGTITNDDVPTVSLSVDDVSVWEGNSEDMVVSFLVTISQVSAVPVTFDYTFSPGTATSPSDFAGYTASNGYITPGRTWTRIAVAVHGDTEAEANETLLVNLSKVVGAVVADGQGIGTILDDDTSPAPPGAPTNVVAVPALLGADVSFDAPASTGTGYLSGYTVTSSPAGAVDDYAGSQSTTHHMSGLVKGTYYTFTVTASNLVGTGPASPPSNSVRPLTLPGPVTVSGLEAGNSMVTVSFNPPADPGDFEIVGYAVETTQGEGYDADSYSPSTTHQIRGLTSGTPYNFRIWAVTQAGPGEAVVSGSAAPHGVAGAPVMGSATGSGSTATVTFSPPSTDGGSPISGYVVRGSSYCNVIDTNSGSLALTHVVKNLPGNTPCTFTAHAINSAGEGPGSAPSNVVTYDRPDLFISFPEIQEGNSGTSVATFTFTLSRTVAHPVSFDVAITGGMATAGIDYVAPTGPVHVAIPAGQTTASFDVTVNGDTQGEADEAIVIGLTNLDGAWSVSQGYSYATIKNDDPLPQLTISDASLVEGNTGYSMMSFDIGLDFPAPCDVRFKASFGGGTATPWQDYNGDVVYGLIPQGSSHGSLNVAVNGNVVIEADESFQVTLSDVTCAIVADGTATGTIINDDTPPLPVLSVNDVSVPEGNSGESALGFRISLSDATDHAVTFDVSTADGSAVAGQDYIAQSTSMEIPAGETFALVWLQVKGDTAEESDESFVVNLGNVVGATVADGQATFTIRNDDAAGPTLSIGDVTITEGNAGTSLATFTVTLSAAQPGPVNFDLATADGTATAGSDYVAKSNPGMRIAAGNTSKTFAVTINGDTTQEPIETFVVNLTNAIGATIADGQAVGTISNDDGAATPTLSIGDTSVSEGNSGTKTLTFTVSLSPAASGPVTYNIASSNGTATSGSDYVAASLSGETIAAGATSKTFAVTINGDTTTEANETFNVTLTNVSGAILGDGSAVGTITNDDGGSTPSLTIADVSIAEGNSLSKQMTFTVKLSAAASGPVTYSIATANGTAISPGDYTAKSLTGQSIAAGATSKAFTVAIKGDRVVESNETFQVNLSSVVGATVSDAQAIGTITNDDAARVGIARFDAGDLVDDIDDGHREPRVTTNEYASLLADSANSLCRRVSNATVIAVDGVENKQVLADLAAAANAVCTNKPRYDAVMADLDSRGFLIAAPAKDEAAVTVLGKPETSAASTVLTLRVPGHTEPVTVVHAHGTSKELAAQLQLRAKAQPTEALVLLGAKAMTGLVDLTARTQAKPGVPLPDERILVNAVLLERYRQPGIELTPLPAKEPPAQVLELQ